MLKNGRRITLSASRGPASSSITRTVGLAGRPFSMRAVFICCHLLRLATRVKQLPFLFSDLRALYHEASIRCGAHRVNTYMWFPRTDLYVGRVGRYASSDAETTR